MPLVYLLGNSPTFIEAAIKVYGAANISIFSWRSCRRGDDLRQPDILLICGYDYKSSLKSFDNYYEANINQPLAWINSVVSSDTKIIYINTNKSNKKYTLSRYLFAKNNLGAILQDLFGNFYSISIPTIFGESGLPLIHGGPITKIIFKNLLRVNLISGIKKSSLSTLIMQIDQKNQELISHIDGIYLQLRRPLFIDRFLRIIFG